MNWRLSILALVTVVVVAAGCRKRSQGGATVATGSEAAATTPAEAPTAKAGASAPPLTPLTPGGEITPAVESRFRSNDPKQPFAPPLAGDYQTQLDTYNRVLRKWVQDQGHAPATLQDLQASYGAPKPPKPPVGKTLVYDRATLTLSLR
jgi:hypothetical protein